VIESFKNVFKIHELRQRVLFTLGLLVVYRIGGHIPTPGIDAKALGEFFSQASGSLFGL
jgi:preprotein translocase subunit SecY